MNTRHGMLVLLLVATGIVSPVPAQEFPEPEGPPAERRLEQYRKLRLMEALKLDEETSIRFFARYSKHQEEMRELQEKVNGVVSRLEEMRKKEVDPKEFEPVLEELRKLQSGMSLQREQYLSGLKEVLTTTQLVDYVVFERNFFRHLRRTLGDIQKERMERRFRR